MLPEIWKKEDEGEEEENEDWYTRSPDIDLFLSCHSGGLLDFLQL